MLPRIASAIGLILLCALALVRDGRAPSVVPATAPDTEFSAERAMRHVEQIAVRPHPMGSADHDRVRDYIVAQLAALGVRAQLQRATAIGTRYQSAGRVENILGWLPGTTPMSKAVLLMAHYDGVGAGPAAGDDGAGSAALLEAVRALRARTKPLAHDVFVVFTDGEEAGLLGAAAFVREHPWAKDVAIALNFEARGTSGRSFMFETGPGNLDAARALRTAGNASAGSVFTTIYRALPNDTDLSELAVLAPPALNFAFADGVERYHTSHDDVAHLNPGSVQHHGSQMLALARTFANEALPRPLTGDGVFFDFPVLGLVVYPQWLSVPLAIVALILVGWVAWRDRNGAVAGVVAALTAILLSGVAAWLIGGRLAGPARWSGLYATGIVLVVVALTLASRALSLRWSNDRGSYAGTLVVWALLAVGVSMAAPGVGYLFTWPAIFAAIAALSPRWNAGLGWLSAAVALLMLAGFAYGATVIMLGLTGVGAIALGVLSALVVLILVPQVTTVVGVEATRAYVARWPATAAAVVFVFAMATVHPSGDHPVRTSLAYVVNADSSDAWLGTFGSFGNDWTRAAIGTTSPPPQWMSHVLSSGERFSGHGVNRTPLDAPNASLARDTLLDGARRVVFRVTAPKGTTALLMRAPNTKVLTASIDGRVVDTTRYRNRLPVWTMEYWAPPDTGGAVIAVSIPVGTRFTLDLIARRPGLPSLPGVTIPPRPDFVVQSQAGDESIVYRRFIF